MKSILLGAAALVAAAVVVPVAGTVATTALSTTAEAQGVTVRIGDGHSRHESRMRRMHRGDRCRTVETRTHRHGRVIITKKRVCR